MWEICFLSTEKELNKERYVKEVEWAEEYMKNGSKIVLVKFKNEKKESLNDGFAYHISIYDGDIEGWAIENYRRFEEIVELNGHFFVSHDLGSVLEFIEEMKAKAL